MKRSGKKGLFFSSGGVPVGVTGRRRAFPPAAVARGVGLFLQQQQHEMGGWLFQHGVWARVPGSRVGVFQRAKNGTFSNGSGDGGGVLAGSWKDGVSIAGWVLTGKKRKLFFSSTGVLPARDDNNGWKN